MTAPYSESADTSSLLSPAQVAEAKRLLDQLLGELSKALLGMAAKVSASNCPRQPTPLISMKRPATLGLRSILAHAAVGYRSRTILLIAINIAVHAFMNLGPAACRANFQTAQSLTLPTILSVAVVMRLKAIRFAHSSR